MKHPEEKSIIKAQNSPTNRIPKKPWSHGSGPDSSYIQKIIFQIGCLMFMYTFRALLDCFTLGGCHGTKGVNLGGWLWLG